MPDCHILGNLICHSGMSVLRDLNPIPSLSLDQQGKGCASCPLHDLFPPLMFKGRVREGFVFVKKGPVI